MKIKEFSFYKIFIKNDELLDGFVVEDEEKKERHLWLWNYTESSVPFSFNSLSMATTYAIEQFDFLSGNWDAKVLDQYYLPGQTLFRILLA
jgi:uncharacterized protein YpiB (UPF0302 family)